MSAPSNDVSYQGLVVHATLRRTSAIRDALEGPRRVDVAGGRTEGKWSDAEGAAVVNMLRRLSAAEVPVLDLHVISQLLIEIQRLRERIMASEVPGQWRTDPYRWIRESVGTVHNVQGPKPTSSSSSLGRRCRPSTVRADGRGECRTSSTSPRPAPAKTST